MFNRECLNLRFCITHAALFLCLSLIFTACGSTADFLAKGEDYLKKRKFHDALMQFRSAAESDSDSAAAHWGLARTYEHLGQFNEVLDELRKTVEYDDANLEAKAKLGSYFLLMQPPMISEAEKLRNEILETDANFIEGHILTASIMAAQGKPDADVVNQVNKAIGLDTTRIESYISLERLYMTREKPAEAEEAITRGIAANPASIAGYTEYGRFLTYADRDAEAEVQFQRAVEVDASSIEAREAIAEFFVTSSQLDKAERAYLELVQIQENSAESRLVLANFYNKANRTNDAVATLEQILAEAPTYVLARYKASEIYLELREPAKVEEHLNALFEINDADTEALMLRARLRMQESKPDDAVKDIEEVLKKFPSKRDALFLIAQARISLGQIDQGKAFIGDLEKYHPTYLKTGLLKIEAAFAASESQNALRIANELIGKVNATVPNQNASPEELHDVRIRAMSSRGLANLDLGKLLDAKIDLTEVTRMSPRSSAAIVNLAKVSVAERDNVVALELYEKALATDARNFDAISGIVNSLIRMQQTATAHSRLENLIVSNAGRADVIAALRYLNSTVFLAEKNSESAEKELLISIETDANYLPAYSAYAGLLAEQNRVDEAVTQYNKIIEKRASAQAYTMIGILEDGRGNITAAEAAYRKALEITPESPIAANNLAWLIVDNHGNLDEALQLATMAVGKNANVAGFYDTLSYVYLKKGLVLPAVEQAKKAVALDEAVAKKNGTAPNAGYRVRLGAALAKAGDKASARREVEMSLKFVNELTQREVTEAKSVLASL
jgi:tetratricopeptide (TPR) repeat protein